MFSGLGISKGNSGLHSTAGLFLLFGRPVRYFYGPGNGRQEVLIGRNIKSLRHFWAACFFLSTVGHVSGESVFRAANGCFIIRRGNLSRARQ